MVKETGKRWPRKGSLVHMLCPFLAAPLAGTLGVSWHWLVGIKPRQGFPFGDCLQSLRGTVKLQSRAGSSLASHRVCHSFTQAHHRFSKVQQKMCIIGEQRTRAPSILTCLKDPRWTPSMKGCGCELWAMPGFVIFGEEDFDLGPELRLDYSKLLCNKVLLKYKRNKRKLLT